MRPFDYTRATSTHDAVRRAAAGGTVWLAGGTDLLPLIKAGVARPERLVDIKRASDLDGEIAATEGGVRIGALTTLTDIEESVLLARQCPLLVEAARSAATPQLRNVATLAGNLLQRPRCWYFRAQEIDCWLKGGDLCPARDGENHQHAIFGEGPCCAVHPSDLAPCLIALDAKVVLRSGDDQERSIDAEAFFAEPVPERRTETLLGDDAMIVAVTIPAPPDGVGGAYVKAMERKSWSFALASVAAVLRFERERIAAARVVLGGVAPTPVRAPDAEVTLAGARAEPAVFERCAEVALAGARPLRQNGYKVALTRALVRRVLTRAAGLAV